MAPARLRAISNLHKSTSDALAWVFSRTPVATHKGVRCSSNTSQASAFTHNIIIWYILRSPY